MFGLSILGSCRNLVVQRGGRSLLISRQQKQKYSDFQVILHSRKAYYISVLPYSVNRAPVKLTHWTFKGLNMVKTDTPWLTHYMFPFLSVSSEKPPHGITSIQRRRPTRRWRWTGLSDQSSPSIKLKAGLPWRVCCLYCEGVHRHTHTHSPSSPSNSEKCLQSGCTNLPSFFIYLFFGILNQPSASPASGILHPSPRGCCLHITRLTVSACRQGVNALLVSFN